MEKRVAVRIDGMLIGARGNLDAYYTKNNLSDQEFSEFAKSIGESMAALIDISTALHRRFPDIVPKELKPPTP